MRIRTIISVLVILAQGCVERFEFAVENEAPGLVIEAQISDVSFSESREYPSDGRYFEVILRRTSDVTNTLDEVVSKATVILLDDSGKEWLYTESPVGSGHYLLFDDDFEAMSFRKYRLLVHVTDQESYESSWEQLPMSAPPMGDVCFEESEILKYIIEANEEVLRSIPGVQVGLELPKIDQSEPLFYRWDFEPLWIYDAPLASSGQPYKTCWATNKNYLSQYELQIDNVGGYGKELFFIEVPVNERILTDLSVLVRQYSVSEDYYYFWDELRKQSERGSIFDAPPYNLQTNIKSTTGDFRVSGYFGVVQEQAKRWYFNNDDLSYYTEDYLRRVCLQYAGPDGPAPECFNCLLYSNGNTTNLKPQWWRQ